MICMKKRPLHYHPIHIVPEKGGFLIVVVIAVVAGFEMISLSLVLADARLP